MERRGIVQEKALEGMEERVVEGKRVGRGRTLGGGGLEGDNRRGGEVSGKTHGRE